MVRNSLGGFVALALVALTGCGGGSAVPTSRGVPDPCRLVKTSEVAKAMKVPITAANKRADNFDSGRRSCAWILGGNPGGRAVVVEVIRPSAATVAANRIPPETVFTVETAIDKTHDIPNLGEKAAEGKDKVSVLVKKTIIQVQLKRIGGQTGLSQAEADGIGGLAVKASHRI
jgi:hypothetical protein